MDTQSQDIKINTCNDCPMHNFDSEYGSFCNHPLAPQNNALAFCDNAENIKTDFTPYGHYHHETHLIPLWCPIKTLSFIDIGIKMPIRFDERLFEENQ